jgi:hypothetical protein
MASIRLSTKKQSLASFGFVGHAVLDLDARVHLHEEVLVALDDRLEGRDAVEADRGAEALGLCLHAREHVAVDGQHLDARGIALGRRDLGLEQLARERDLEQLLLVHLHRAVAAAERHAPLSVADQLDLVVARRLDVELDQEVAVAAGGYDLGLRQHVHHRGGDLAGSGDHALALAAAAADVLVTDAALGMRLPDRLRLFERRSLQLLDRHQFDALRVAGLQQRLGVVLERGLGVVRKRQPAALGERREARLVLRPREQRQRADVVDPRRDRVAELARELLGLVLGARAARDARRRADEAQPRLLDRLDELGVLGHEAVAREDVRVAVVPGDGDDLADALALLFLAGAHVVGNAVHVLGEAEAAQLGREAARIDDAVLLRQQHAVAVHPDCVEDLDRLLAHRPAAHDQALDLGQRERSGPHRVGAIEAQRLHVTVEHHSNSLCTPDRAEGS